MSFTGNGTTNSSDEVEDLISITVLGEANKLPEQTPNTHLVSTRRSGIRDPPERSEIARSLLHYLQPA